ncbi:hypothetical protein JEG40_11965, partial [Streptococcus agalactiae]|nr:hypothetical protein [Streptococcus agalactiae]
LAGELALGIDHRVPEFLGRIYRPVKVIGSVLRCLFLAERSKIMRLTDFFVSARKVGIEHSDSVSNISPVPCFEEPSSIRQTDIPEFVLIVS